MSTYAYQDNQSIYLIDHNKLAEDFIIGVLGNLQLYTHKASIIYEFKLSFIKAEKASSHFPFFVSKDEKACGPCEDSY
jgi:3-deoxy-D-manno-octulosonic acid (KDO) 8-phosphate synthase